MKVWRKYLSQQAISCSVFSEVLWMSEPVQEIGGGEEKEAAADTFSAYSVFSLCWDCQDGAQLIIIVKPVIVVETTVHRKNGLR